MSPMLNSSSSWPSTEETIMECTKSSTITAFEVLDIASFPADDKSAAAQKAADVKDVYVDDKEVTILTILKCYRILAAFGDALYPRKEVNNVFERLVSTCITQIGTISEEEILNDPRILAILPSLRDICSKGEFLLESVHAQRLLISNNPSLTTFPYHENYASLVRLELAALNYAAPAPFSYSSSTTPHIQKTKIAFIGCGPLPMSSFCLIEQLSSLTIPQGLTVSREGAVEKNGVKKGVIILNVDYDLEALRMAQGVAKKLGFGPEVLQFLGTGLKKLGENVIDQRCDAAEGFHMNGNVENPCFGEENGGYCGAEESPERKLAVELATTDILIVAALVGSTAEEKRAVLRECTQNLRVGTRILVRTAKGLRGILYPVVEPADLDIVGVEWVCIMHPLDDVVNSVIVGRVV